MEENLAETLLDTKDVLRWLGKYREANALVMLSRLLRVHDLDTLDKLTAFVEREEDAHEHPETLP